MRDRDRTDWACTSIVSPANDGHFGAGILLPIVESGLLVADRVAESVIEAVRAARSFLPFGFVWQREYPLAAAEPSSQPSAKSVRFEPAHVCDRLIGLAKPLELIITRL